MIILVLENLSTSEKTEIFDNCWYTNSDKLVQILTNKEPSHWCVHIYRVDEDHFNLVFQPTNDVLSVLYNDDILPALVPVQIRLHSRIHIGDETFVAGFETPPPDLEGTIRVVTVNAQAWYALDRGTLKMQQDAVGCFSEADQQLWIVSDGVGGGREAEVGSRACVQMIAHSFFDTSSQSDAPEVRLHRAIAYASQRLLDYASRRYPRDKNARVAAAVVVLALVQNKWYLTHVGDCRAYHRRLNGRLVQMTVDYTYAQKAIDTGETLEIAAKQPNAKQMASAVGWKALVVSPVQTIQAKPKDRWLLCSDGLTNDPHKEVIVGSHVLEDAMSTDATHGIAKMLVKTALERGSDDNITAMVIEAKRVTQGLNEPPCQDIETGNPQIVHEKSSEVIRTKRRFWQIFG